MFRGNLQEAKMFKQHLNEYFEIRKKIDAKITEHEELRLIQKFCEDLKNKGHNDIYINEILASRNEENKSLLCFAIETRSLKLIEFLLDRQIPINENDINFDRLSSKYDNKLIYLICNHSHLKTEKNKHLVCDWKSKEDKNLLMLNILDLNIIKCFNSYYPSLFDNTNKFNETSLFQFIYTTDPTRYKKEITRSIKEIFILLVSRINPFHKNIYNLTPVDKCANNHPFHTILKDISRALCDNNHNDNKDVLLTERQFLKIKPILKKYAKDNDLDTESIFNFSKKTNDNSKNLNIEGSSNNGRTNKNEQNTKIQKPNQSTQNISNQSEKDLISRFLKVIKIQYEDFKGKIESSTKKETNKIIIKNRNSQFYEYNAIKENDHYVLTNKFVFPCSSLDEANEIFQFLTRKLKADTDCFIYYNNVCYYYANKWLPRVHLTGCSYIKLNKSIETVTAKIASSTYVNFSVIIIGSTMETIYKLCKSDAMITVATDEFREEKEKIN